MNPLIEKQPIITDFHTFLDYIQQANGMELTKTKQAPRTADLLQLNEQIHFRAAFVNNKSQLQRFSLLNTFFHIATVSRLAEIRKEKGKFKLFVNPEELTKFHSFDAAEQYFFLFESFWCYIDWETAYDIRSFWDNDFYESLVKEKVGEWVTIAERNIKRSGKLSSPLLTDIPEVFAAFGFMELIWDTNLEKRPSKYTFPYSSIALSALGKKMLSVLFKYRQSWAWLGLDPYHASTFEKSGQAQFLFMMRQELLQDQEEDVVSPYKEPFAAAFLTVLSDLKVEKSWYPMERSSIDAQLSFRIELNKKLYRDVELPSNYSLEELHLVIQEVYSFGNDHLFAFYMDRTRSENQTYSDPRAYDGYGTLADNVQLGQLNLYEGKQFTYLFDFGASWIFEVTVLKIDREAKLVKEFKLIKSVGESPEQYPYYDEEDW